MDNKQLRNQTDFLLNEQNKMQEMEKAIAFFKQEALTAKTKVNYLKMDLDKRGDQFAQKEREILETKRIATMEEGKLKIKEAELRETSAKLSVYQQLESTSRLTSLNDDIEPELLKNKNLKQKCEDLERQVAILSQKNQSELSTQVLVLQQKVDDGERELQRQIEINKMSERQNDELRNRNSTM